MAVEGAEYRVRAKLELDKNRDAERQAVRIQREVRGLGDRLRGANQLAGGLTRNLVGLGLAYQGVRTLTGAMTGLIRGSVEYTASLERTRIGISAVLVAATDGALSMQQAAEVGGEVFNQLRTDAIKSVGTAQELFGIYQSIVGPITAAGKGLGVVRELTNSTVAAASVLGVDFAQAQRDINMMVRGAAGMDVKLFSMLRSTGAIAETTEDWNKKLSASERIEKLREALGKFAPAAEQYAKSWAGVTSTFQDVKTEMGRAAMQPILDAAARGLGRLNDKLVELQEEVNARLRTWGEQFGSVVERAFGKAVRGVDYVVQHWDELLAKGQEFANKMLAAAKAVAAVKGAEIGLGLGAQAFGAVDTVRNLLLPSAGVAGGAAIGASTTAAAASGTAASTPEALAAMYQSPLAAGAGGGGGMASGAAMATVAGQATLFASVLVAVAERWTEITSILQISFGGLGDELMAMFKSLWAGVRPLLSLFGQGAALGLTGILAIVGTGVKLLVSILRELFERMAVWTSDIERFWKPRFDMVWETFQWLADKLKEWVARVRLFFGGEADDPFLSARVGYRGMEGQPFDMQKAHPLISDFNMVEGLDRDFNAVSGQSEVHIPKGRTQLNVDMRGSKIEVKQRFDKADPDRVLVQMVDALARQAEMRLQSGFMPALAR